MPQTEHMKILLNEAETEHTYCRRNVQLEELKSKGKIAQKWHLDQKNNKRRAKILDDSREYLDSYSSIDVGTKFFHLRHKGGRGFRSTDGSSAQYFSHIIDLDANAYEQVLFRRFLREVLASATFRNIILGLVIVNAILIGLNTSVVYSQDFERTLEVVDQILLTVFTFEILMKWMYDFRAFWIVRWNLLDLLILVLIVYATLTPTFTDTKTLLALVRVARALRSLRAVNNLSSLTIVSRTIFKSVVDMINILFVLIIFMIVMAITGVVLFDDDSLKSSSRFLSALDAWFVLFICVTQDGWIEVLDLFRNNFYFFLAAIYLVIGVAIGAFVFANLIVAVVVANLESSIRGLKAEKAKLDNPLIYYDEFSPNVIDIVPTYQQLRSNTNSVYFQRPFSAPRLDTAGFKRKLRVYVQLIVTLEQNMLESSVIENDLIRVLSVMLSITHQMEKSTVPSTPAEIAARIKKAKETYSTSTIPTESRDPKFI